MKFTQFLTVLAATSSIFASVIPEKDQTVDEDELAKCFAAITTTKECTSTIHDDAEDYKRVCSLYETEKCQNIYKSGLFGIPECKNVDKILIIGANEMLKVEYQQLKFYCSKDEKGNYCPFTPMELQENYGYEESNWTKNTIINKAIKDSCKSKKCTDAYLTLAEEAKVGHQSFYDELKKSGYGSKDIEELKNKLESIENKFHRYIDLDSAETYLKSEQCTSEAAKDGESVKNGETANNDKAAKDGEVAKSDATHITYSSVLFVTLAALLSSLL